MLIFGIVAIIAIVVMMIVAVKHRQLWAVLVVVAIGASGIVYEQVSFIDEIMIASAVIGAVLAISLCAVDMRPAEEDKLARIHKTLFYLLIAYMVIESARGMIVLGSIKKIRWVMYFLLLGSVPMLLSRRGFKLPDARQVMVLIAMACIGYFMLYIAVGLYDEFVLGINRYEMQNIHWGGTAYATYPIAISVPVAFLLTDDHNENYRWLGWACLFFSAFIAFFYDSRAAWFVILVFMAASFVRLDVKKVLIVSAIFFAMMAFCIQYVWPSFRDFDAFWEEQIYSSSKMFWDPEHNRAGDMGRIVHISMSLKLLTADLKTILIGTGFRASGDLVSTQLVDMLYEAGEVSAAKKSVGYGSTVGITTLVLETGIVGLVLTLLNYVVVAMRILAIKARKMRMYLMMSLIISFLWLVITNTMDIMLFYFLIMPYGIFVCWCGDGRELNEGFHNQLDDSTCRG